MKKLLLGIISCALALPCYAYKSDKTGKIDRKAVVTRNNPHITKIDSLSSLSVGNGNFAFTVDVTGLQTFPERYRKGVPLGTQSQWGWHSSPNPNGYTLDETMETYDLGHGHEESYPVQSGEKGRRQEAVNYLRANPHKIHLGIVGFEITDNDGNQVGSESISSIRQSLDLWQGIIYSRFSVDDSQTEVKTVCHPYQDMIAAEINSELFVKNLLKIKFRFPYPTSQHSDDACDWNSPDKHSTKIISQGDRHVVFERELDSTTYYVTVNWKGKASVKKKDEHYFLLSPEDKEFSFTVSFDRQNTRNTKDSFRATAKKSKEYWKGYWSKGGFVDFGDCKDPRARELERRVILSQQLMAIQCSGTIPPQETGLTYNSWHGKFHLEMHWWHAVHFALWNRIDMMERSLDWYAQAEPMARETARRQGFDGIRWMKMTDPSGMESPSNIGPFLIWQQPHFIYMTELIYRQKRSPKVIEKYKDLVFKTAEFMASFVTYDEANDRYVLKGLIPAQETLGAKETVNPPFELSYWHYALNIVQLWRERAGLQRDPQWDDIIEKLSPLAEKEGLYLAAETAPDTYHNGRFTSDHMAVLGAFGILPENRLFEKETMKRTLEWVLANWNWNHTWGWDYPMTAMCAARLGEADKAVGTLLMDKRTNTYLANGHNYQNNQLRIYLPGNGGLLTTIAMMCAGWDGSTEETPGFPKDGNWNVKWEDLVPMP